MEKVKDVVFFRFYKHRSRPFPNAILCFALILCILLVPFTGHAFEGAIEKDLQLHLDRSRTIVATIYVKLSSGGSVSSDIAKLKSLADDIRISDLLLEERFRLRAEKVKVLGPKAIKRHQAMAEGYRKALTEYLKIIDGLPLDGTSSQASIRNLQSLLEKILPKKTRPLIGSLPYKHLNYPAQEPSPAPEITPAYRGGNKTVSPDDTKSTETAPISKTIADLAQSLNWQPVAEYEYVKNNIETEWYWGCQKGAEETLRQKSGNDCDQALLLASLLKASGFPTRLVRGNIQFFASDDKPIERIKNLTGIDDPAKIAEFFQKAGIPYKPILAGGKVVNFEISHIYIESQIPYANYRGIVIDEHGKTWLGLDTGIKTTDYVYNNPKDLFEQPELGDRLSGIRDEYFALDLNSQPSTTRPATPLEYLQSRINSELTAQNSQLTYNDFLRTKTLTPEPMKFLPASLQFKLIKATNEYTEIPDELIYKVRLKASRQHAVDSIQGDSLFDITIPLYKLSNQQIAITYEPETVQDQEIIDSYGGLDNTPAYLVRLRAVLAIGKERIIVAQDGLPMGADYTLTMELYSPSVNGGATSAETITNTLITGNLSVIGITAQRAVLTPSPLAGEGGGEGAKDAERLLYETANHYIDRWNHAEDELASLLHLSITRPLPTVVTLGGVIDVVSFMGMPHTFTWKGEYIDADLRTIEAVRSAEFGVGSEGEREKLLMQLSSLQGSVLEHKVFEDDFQVPSISTAKLLQIANTQPAVPIVAIDQNNVATILPTLSLDQGIKDDIANAVNQNYTIRIPQAEMSYLDWTGTGYVKEDLATGQSGWMLSGMIAGGMTAVSPNKWISQYNETVLGNPYNDNSRNIYITSPKNESTVSAPYVTVTGVVLDPEAGVTVNGVQAEVQDTTFTAAVALTSGSNTITAVATNKSGKTTFDIIVIRYKIPVKIYITYPFDGAELSVTPIYLEGVVSDPATSVFVNGVKGTVSSDGRFIADGITLAEGQNQIIASAMNADGDLDSQTITINYHVVQSPPSLMVSVTSPANGATINKPSTTVVGTITSTADEVWVSVNNMPATIYNNQFVVNNVPLTNGSNRLIVNAMDSNGGMTRQELSVTADTTAPYVKLNASITSGTAPLPSSFVVTTSLPNAVASYQIDFEGRGTIGYSGTTFEDISHAYSSEGIYSPRVTITDSMGNTFTDTVTIIVLNAASLEDSFTQKWERMKIDLISGNIDHALTCFDDASKESFRKQFNSLAPQLSKLVEDMGAFRLANVTEHIAECDMRTLINGETYSFQVLLIRNRYGKWGIKSF